MLTRPTQEVLHLLQLLAALQLNISLYFFHSTRTRTCTCTPAVTVLGLMVLLQKLLVVQNTNTRA